MLCNKISFCWFLVCWAVSLTCCSNHEVAFPVAVPGGEKIWPKVKYQRCTWQDHLTPHSSSKIQILPYPILFPWISCEDQPIDNISQDMMTTSDLCPNCESPSPGNDNGCPAVNSWRIWSLLSNKMLRNELPAVEIPTPWSTSVNRSNNAKRFAENNTELTVLEQVSRIS